MSRILIFMTHKTPIYTFPSFQSHEPCEYFSNGKPSPTFNKKSHDRWGARHVRALDKLHEYLPPTYWATIKFNRPEQIATIKAFTKSLTRAVGYHNRTRPDHLALFGVLEIEGDASVHLHVLVRSGDTNPLAFLAKAADKFNKKYGTTITVPYCQRPDDAIDVTHYLFKLGSKDKLLFARNLGMRFVFQCGRYFIGATKAELERRGRADFVQRKYEAQADAAVCTAEDCVKAQGQRAGGKTARRVKAAHTFAPPGHRAATADEPPGEARLQPPPNSRGPPGTR